MQSVKALSYLSAEGSSGPELGDVGQPEVLPPQAPRSGPLLGPGQNRGADFALLLCHLWGGDGSSLCSRCFRHD